MCMTALMLASLAVTAASTVAQITAANDAAQQAYEAEQRNLQETYKENYRQQQEVMNQAQEQISDRLRQSRIELGTINTVAAEMGASGSSLAALLGESAYITGVDLSRIERNRDSDIERLNAANRAGRVGYVNRTSLAANQAKNAKTSAILGGIGTGLQIASDYNLKKTQLDIADHKI